METETPKPRPIGTHSRLTPVSQAHYFQTGESAVFSATAAHSYYFTTFVGHHLVKVEMGDSVYFFNENGDEALLKSGPCQITSKRCATVIRGFMPADRSCTLRGTTLLPYINGCSTKQIFEPPRLGDPTLQYLMIPAGSSEQAHHIHPTVRVVYVLEGRGVSVVGMPGHQTETELSEGMVCILDPMCPHHFCTPYAEDLIVVPLHVFSSVRGLETNHPMYNGTHLV